MGKRLRRFFRRLAGRQQRTLNFCAFAVSEHDLEQIGKLFR
jgi:hypothetical protein